MLPEKISRWLAQGRVALGIASVLEPAVMMERTCRVGRGYAWFAGVVCGLVLGAVADRHDATLEAEIVRTALTVLSVAATAVAYGSARDLGPSEERCGVADLLSLRGIAGRRLLSARTLATMRVVGHTILFPAWVFVIVSLVCLRGELSRSLTWAIAVTAYAFLAGVVFGGLARLLQRALGRFAKAGLLGVILVPHAVHAMLPASPSLVSLFGDLIAHLSHVGSTAA